MIKRFRSIFRNPPDRSDTLLTLGSMSLCHGAYLIYKPSAYILCGIIMIAVSVISARPTPQGNKETE